ncbi:AmmeMemoRadiSam system protein A [Olsenella profusa]|uniref:AmmeMemoRadiSam system protein A n=1 Tax=Olsenella profusa TaxID=138595 RepID=A0ABS2F0W0_9ACTN|nr:AmmeMemoRadiSam system protein A [Olsenella profusa]MBM6774510.1 AmmeMemoRadiSam system protein A [Olsenella profusa]
MSVVAAFAVPHPPVIVPGVGHGREEGAAATIAAYEEAARRIADLAPDTLVISSPHTVSYLDYLHVSPGRGAHGDFSDFGDRADSSSVIYDEEFVRELCAEAEDACIPAGTRGERDPSLDWGVLVPLHFIQQRRDASEFKVVRMGLAGFSPIEHYRLGRLVQQTAERLGRRVVYVASGDLSHKLSADGLYGFHPDGPTFDQAVCDVFETGNFLSLLTMDPGLCERAAECGLRSFQIMAGALDGTPVRPELLSHEAPFGVGYGVAAFTPTGPAGSDPARSYEEAYLSWHADQLAQTRATEDPYVRLARASLESYVRTGKSLRLPDDLPAGLASRRAGAFVSLKKDGRLRGCIGTIAPTRASLAEEIVANAVSAGCHDPRFSPVTADELDELVYDVDVLGAPEPVADRSQLDPARYGVIVSTPDGRRGLLLPALDGVDTADEQLRIAARKGGISLAKKNVRLERFEVVRHP